MASGRRLREAAPHRLDHRRRGRRRQLPDAGGRVEDGVDGGLRVLRRERQTAGEHLVEHHAQRPEVGAVVDGVAQHLLRRHVEDGSQGAPVLGELFRSEQLGDAEIEDLHRPAVRHQDVGGLDVAVDDPQLVSPRQPLGDLGGDVEGAVERQGAAGDLLLQRLPGVVGHGHEHPAVRGLVDLVDDADVGVLEAGDRLRLLQEARARQGVARQLGGDELDGDLPAELQILGLVDDTHPPLADLLDHPVFGDGLADHRLGRL
jgi:hypothetical protein